MDDRSHRTGPARTLLLFAGVLLLAVLGGLAVGSWVGPTEDPPPTTTVPGGSPVGTGMEHGHGASTPAT